MSSYATDFGSENRLTGTVPRLNLGRPQHFGDTVICIKKCHSSAGNGRAGRYSGREGHDCATLRGPGGGGQGGCSGSLRPGGGPPSHQRESAQQHWHPTANRYVPGSHTAPNCNGG